MMRRVLLLVATLLTAVPAAAPLARAGSPEGALLRACLLGAARLHQVPPFALVVLLTVEGGKLGMRSPNTNGTGDLGPWQVNEIWVPRLAAHWGLSREETHRLVREDLCANADAAAWIFGLNLREAGGDLWEGVARYHSMRGHLQDVYLAKALRAAQALKLEVRRDR